MTTKEQKQLSELLQPFVEVASMTDKRFTVKRLIKAFNDYGFFFLVPQEPKEKTQFLDYLEEEVVPHKIAVWKAGLALMRNHNAFRQINVPFEDFKNVLFQHDLSMFDKEEAIPIASKVMSADFYLAKSLHVARNQYHPKYWSSFLNEKTGKFKSKEMPMIFIAELIAEWMAFNGETFQNSLEDFLSDNLHRFEFQKKTATTLLRVLNSLGVHVEFLDNSTNRLAAFKKI